MSNRITKGILNRQIDWLNQITGLDYSLDWSNGGTRIFADSGSRSLFRRGTKRDTSELLSAMLQMAYDLRSTGDNTL